MELEHMIDELKGTTKKMEKEKILLYYLTDEEFGDYLKFLLRETFDPNLLHHVVLKPSDIPRAGILSMGDMETEVRNLFQRLHNELSPAKNKLAIRDVMDKMNKSNQQLLVGVINKKLRCGVSISTINKVVPDTIEVVKVPLAKKYDPDKPHLYSSQLFLSMKLDGQRVFAIRNTEGWSKHSRAGDYLGNKIETLDHWDEELEKYYTKTGMNFIDGEAYKHGMAFEKITGLVKSSVNKKDATVLNYHIFYVGRIRDIAEASKSNSITGAPPETLYEVFKRYRYLRGVKQTRILNNESRIFEEIDKAVADGYEGVMLRSADNWCDFKRSNFLLKAKKSDLSGTIEQTDAYVEDIEYGDFAVRENGVESVEKLPIALLVVLPNDETAKQMKVGSGFSLKNRRDWLSDESLIVEQMIEVEHQGFGANGRMRFPVYKRVRNDL
jgi:ATP-dependent DNA ligase